MNRPFDLHPERSRLIRKLRSIADLSPEDEQAVFGLPMTFRSLGPDQDIVREGDRPSQCCLVVEGFACRYKLLPGGKRQIMSFHIAGDIPDLQSLYLDVMDHSLGTLVACRIALISHDSLREVARGCPGIGAAFWRDTLIDAAVFREWMVGLGRRDAYGRIAHLFCEMFVRLKAVGLADGETYDLPITQAELGDALGLSTVHVNRVLQELRANGLIRSQGRLHTVLDWPGLSRAGQFDPTYLHLRDQAAAA
jgi:CRP-like cAMP-binding protein